ncbi:MAG: CusA/CzcA family heavy metal efflux RND transporter [Candidatus Omnitrophica bacterium]|nr:CusA/CzcA family heavy metal efflux RND transporter [Candidatus Omnitrophota bacterium]
MLSAIIRWSLENRLVVLVLTLLMVLWGGWSFRNLRIDAFPDTSPVQVQINTVATNLSPEEIEQQITLPVELALSGLPGLEVMRSLSKFGFSQVIVIFDDHTDIYRARQVIGERLQSVSLPEGIEPPRMGPITTGLGEVFHYLVSSSSRDLTELRTLHDWVVKPILASVPGVAEVNAWGGNVKQYHVLLDPLRLVKYGLSLDDLEEALRKNNANVGGGNITQAGEQILIYGVGRARQIEDIRNIVIASHEGIPVKVGDVANVEIGHEIRRGATTAMGTGEVVLGLAFMLKGENTRQVSQALEDKLSEVRTALPSDVQIDLAYSRMHLVEAVLKTVRKNLFEGAVLVIAILFLMMGNFQAGVITSLSIPLSMLFTFITMRLFNIEGSLMSLGAIDFGIVADSSIIIVENAVRRLSERKDASKDFLETVRDACIEVRRPTTFGEAIIMIVYLPILTLHGVEGKLFKPMAVTFLFCLLGSFILSLTLMPVLASFFLPNKISAKENIVMRILNGLYAPVLRWSLRWRWTVMLASVLILVLTGVIATQLGTEFIPRLSEGSIVANTVRLAGVSLEESVRYGQRIEKVLLDFFPDEIDKVWTRTGTAEIATDPMGLEVSDIFITLKPREAWKAAHDQPALIDKMRMRLEELPGMRVVFSQPIEMRMSEMVAGARGDVAIKLFGDDLAELTEIATGMEALLRGIPGSADVRTDQLTGLPVLEARLNHAALARNGVEGSRVMDMVEAIGGRHVGEIREGMRRFDLLVRLDEKYRSDSKALGRILVTSADGAVLPLSDLANLAFTEGPASINREWSRRVINVQCNVHGRDVGSFVDEVRSAIDSGVTLPAGYYYEIGGQFEHMLAARGRLSIVVPISLALIFLLLYLTYNSARDALLVSTKIPFAIVGGVMALYWRGMPFSISAAIGFIALFGIAILNGLVVVSSAKRLMTQGRPLQDAVYESAISRLRPVLATAVTDVAGFIPMALSLGVGAEVQRPLATVLIGGMISSTVLTLVVLPVLYSLFGKQMDSYEDSGWV